MRTQAKFGLHSHIHIVVDSLRVPTPIFSNKLRTQALLVCSMHFLFENDAPRAQPSHGTCVVVAFALAPLLLPLSPAREVSPDIIWKMKK